MNVIVLQPRCAEMVIVATAMVCVCLLPRRHHTARLHIEAVHIERGYALLQPQMVRHRNMAQLARSFRLDLKRIRNAYLHVRRRWVQRRNMPLISNFFFFFDIQILGSGVLDLCEGQRVHIRIVLIDNVRLHGP